MNRRSKEAEKMAAQMMKDKNLDDILTIPLVEQRKMWEEASLSTELPENVKSVEEKIAGMTVEWLIPNGSREEQLILYFHGGGLNQGSIVTHRKLCSAIAAYTGKRVLNHNYPLAPEHPYPEAMIASEELYLNLLKKGFVPSNILFGSDSSGSTLSLGIIQRLKERGEGLPKASFHLSPMVDYSLSGSSISQNKDKDPQLFKEDLEMTAAYYCKKELRRDKGVSPLFGDFSDFPPIHIQAGSDELLVSDAQRLAEYCKAAGVHTEFIVWEGMWHVFQTRFHRVPEAADSLKAAARFVNEQLRTVKG